MEPRPNDEVELQEFLGRYNQELDELLEMGLFDEEPLPPDPSSMGLGETSLEELDDIKKDAIKSTLFQKFGIGNEQLESPRREYVSIAPEEALVPGEIKTKVFKTNRDGTFLQQLTYQDGQQRFVIGPDQNV